MIGIKSQTEKYKAQAKQLNEFVAQSKCYRSKIFRKRYSSAFDQFKKSINETEKGFAFFGCTFIELQAAIIQLGRAGANLNNIKVKP